MRCSFWLWLCGSAAALSPLNVLVISFGQHPCPPAHPAYRQTDRETDTHTHKHIAKLISWVTGYNHPRARAKPSQGNRKQTERERERTEKTWPKIDYGQNGQKTPEGSKCKRERTPRWEDGNADQATIIKILLVGHCMGRRVARPESAPESSFQLPALSLSSCLHFVSVYLPN